MNMKDMAGLTIACNKAGLSAGTTTTISIANATPYCINGKAYIKAIAANGAAPTTDAMSALAFRGVKANSGSVFAICLDTSGVIQAVQGEIVALDAAGAFADVPEISGVPDNVCPIGYLLIKAGSTADAVTGWLMGSSNTASVTGITYTWVDCMALPNRPQIA